MPTTLELAQDRPADGFDLTCPSCGARLAGAPAWETFRLCPGCGRHFPLPARERLRLLLDPGSFRETNARLVSVDPLVWADRAPADGDPLAEVSPSADDAVVTGIGRIGGVECVPVALDHAFLGAAIGPVAGEKIALAFDLAAARNLPLVALCSAGGARTEGGALSLWQEPKLAAAVVRLRRAGIPFVGVAVHPLTGAVWGALPAHADLVLAEPGAQVDFGGARPGLPGAGAVRGVDDLRRAGMIDAVVERPRLRATLASLLALFADRGDVRPLTRHERPPRPEPPDPAERPAVPSWKTAELARHPERPTALHLLRRLVVDWFELEGDRAGGHDSSLVCGLGRLGGAPVAVIAGSGRVPGAAAWGVAARLLRLAGHLELPVIALVDGPLEPLEPDAETPERAAAIAAAMGLVALLPSPVVAAVTGETGGAGAIALCGGDRTLMLEHARFVAPNGAVRERPIPGVAPVREPEAPLLAAPVLSARDCRRLGLVDAIVPEPAPGAHADPDAAAAALAGALADALADLGGVGPRRLRDDRARRLRSLGQTTPEGRAAALYEVREWQEVQRRLARSVAEWRERWQSRGKLHLPNLPQAQLPALPHLPWRAEGAEGGERRLPDLADLAARLGKARPAARPDEPEPPPPDEPR